MCSSATKPYPTRPTLTFAIAHSFDVVGDQPLTPERGEEIANTMAGAGCTARLPSADARGPPRFPPPRVLRKRAPLSPQTYLKATDTLSGWQACRCPRHGARSPEETECWK